jgi:ABC-type Zn uptake system ZnuABC Zn-binding protein ZnuA
MYSEQTYQMGGRDKLKAALKQNGHTAEEINETLSFVDDALDYIKILAAGYAKNMGYTKLSNHLVADSVAEAAGVGTAMFHTCHNVSREEMEAGATYLSLMKNNLETLKAQ